MDAKVFNVQMRLFFDIIINSIAGEVAKQFGLEPAMQVVQGCVRRRQIRHFSDLLSYEFIQNVAARDGLMYLSRVENCIECYGPERVVSDYIKRFGKNAVCHTALSQGVPEYYVAICAKFLFQLSE